MDVGFWDGGLVVFVLWLRDVCELCFGDCGMYLNGLRVGCVGRLVVKYGL